MPALIHHPEVWLFTLGPGGRLSPRRRVLLLTPQIHNSNLCLEHARRLGALFFCCCLVDLTQRPHSRLLRPKSRHLSTHADCLCGSGRILVAVFVLINKLQRKKTSPEKIAKAVEGARKLFPVKGSERILWIAVSLTAGFCEEFLYRGWLLNPDRCHRKVRLARTADFVLLLQLRPPLPRTQRHNQHRHPGRSLRPHLSGLRQPTAWADHSRPPSVLSHK